MRYYIAALIIIFLFTGMASAWAPGDIEWASAVTGTLHKGASLSNGNYTVKVVQLTSPVQGDKDIYGNIHPDRPVYDPSALVDIYKNGVFMQEIVMSYQSYQYIDPDYEVMISIPDSGSFPASNAIDWVYEYYNPWVKIAISVRGKPKLEVTVTTDKTTYTSSRDLIITANVAVKNSGDAIARNVDVNLNTGGLQVRGDDTKQLHQYYSTLVKGKSSKFSVTLVVPSLIDQQSYFLKVDAKGTDVKDIRSNATGTVSITVSPPQNFFTISKAVRDRMYLQNTAVVTISVGNSGIYDIHDIHINDSLDENFDLKSNTSFHWDVPVLKPGQEWGTTYSIKPLETNLGGFTIPAATAQFTVNNKPYSASSNIPKIVVNGPKMIINKTVDKQTVNISEYVIVNVSVNNRGNIGTRFEVKDSLPDGVSLTAGSTSFANWSDPNSVLKFNYTICMNKEGKIELPSAISNYTNVEYRGTTRAVLSSEKPVITVIDKSKVTPVRTGTALQGNTTAQTIQGETTSTPIPTDDPEPTPTPITPGFGIGFAIVVLVIMAAIKRR
ncbi:MAG: hypothetical protein OIN85_06260 [Candidatus Methanoperedens sp.]|nr:hypothetical protein [Candidatus Methanoperedens sp.]